MTEAISSKEIISELKSIKEDLDYIKEHMVDVDFILTAEEEKRLKHSLKDYNNKNIVDLASFEKELGM